MNFHKPLLAFTVILLSTESFTVAVKSTLNFKILQRKVANANLVPEDEVNKIINLKELLLKKATYSSDCSELFEKGFNVSGRYVIQPEPFPRAPILVVHCNMSYDCSGWTVLHRNTRQSEMTWNETWTAYKYGFGNIMGDHYIGNEYMHFITSQKWYKARIIIDEGIHQTYAEYDIFRIAGEDTNYRLHLGAYRGSAGDALSTNENMVDNLPFSTRDNDVDNDEANCALKYGGGWWFNSCSAPNPFAMLTQKESIHWEPFCKDCRHVVLLVKRVDMYCRNEAMRPQQKY